MVELERLEPGIPETATMVEFGSPDHHGSSQEP